MASSQVRGNTTANYWKMSVRLWWFSTQTYCYSFSTSREALQVVSDKGEKRLFWPKSQHRPTSAQRPYYHCKVRICQLVSRDLLILVFLCREYVSGLCPQRHQLAWKRAVNMKGINVGWHLRPRDIIQLICWESTMVRHMVRPVLGHKFSVQSCCHVTFVPGTSWLVGFFGRKVPPPSGDLALWRVTVTVSQRMCLEVAGSLYRNGLETRSDPLSFTVVVMTRVLTTTLAAIFSRRTGTCPPNEVDTSTARETLWVWWTGF